MRIELKRTLLLSAALFVLPLFSSVIAQQRVPGACANGGTCPMADQPAIDSSATQSMMGSDMNCPMMSENGQSMGMHGAGMQQGMQGMAADSNGMAGGMMMGGMKMGMKAGMSGMSMSDMKSCPMMASADSSSLSPQVIRAIGEALQDEYRTEALYQRVLDDHGSVMPFSNVVNAERMHSAHLIALLESHGAEVPDSDWTTEKSPAFTSVQEACAASATAEIDNIALYDRLLTAELPDDIRSTFEHLRMVSHDRHLPAFRRCAGL